MAGGICAFIHLTSPSRIPTSDDVPVLLHTVYAFLLFVPFPPPLLTLLPCHRYTSPFLPYADSQNIPAAAARAVVVDDDRQTLWRKTKDDGGISWASGRRRRRDVARIAARALDGRGTRRWRAARLLLPGDSLLTAPTQQSVLLQTPHTTPAHTTFVLILIVAVGTYVPVRGRIPTPNLQYHDDIITIGMAFAGDKMR